MWVARMKIGSLFSGYGGLDMGVQSVLGGEVAWHVEFDAAPSKILAHHWPDVPNYGDITKVDFSQVEPVDIITGGFPCQDLSLAGRRAGMRPGTRSGLWADYLRAIDTLRPKLAVIENVRGLLSGCAESEADSDLGPCPRCAGDKSARHAPNVRALGRVLIDLARIGYDARWVGLRAADAGAPHNRFRVFVLAYPASARRSEGEDRGTGGSHAGAGSWRLELERGSGERASTAEDADIPTGGERRFAAPGQEEGGRTWADTGGRGGAPVEWGDYGPAVHRWEFATGRLAPAPTRPDGRAGGHRLNPEFVEWMMGLPAGHVTEVDITRAQQLKALGNGVVPQQAAFALSVLLSHSVGTPGG